MAGIGHWYLGSVNWALLWPLLLGSVPGIVVGSRGGVRDGAIRTALALVLIAVAGKLIL